MLPHTYRIVYISTYDEDGNEGGRGVLEAPGAAEMAMEMFDWICRFATKMVSEFLEMVQVLTIFLNATLEV